MGSTRRSLGPAIAIKSQVSCSPLKCPILDANVLLEKPVKVADGDVREMPEIDRLTTDLTPEYMKRSTAVMYTVD